MSSRLSLLAFYVALCLCSASTSSDVTTPYQIRLVVHVEKHPQLTKVFRERVGRELGDGLQAALGAMARVTVTDTHPELTNIRQHGLAKALDGYRERSEELTYFVLIDFTGTRYRIRTRLHSGPIGLPSPVVRTATTDDREYVAHEAAMLLAGDLGLLGTVKNEPDKEGEVTLALRGGGLGVDPSKWVKPGVVFRLARVGGVGPGQVVEGAFLQVVKPVEKGECKCKLYSRYRQPRVAGLTAELLGTREGPLRLRVLQEKPGGVGSLESPVTLHLRKNGFEGEDTTRLSITTAGRDIDTRKGQKGNFSRLAFVTVLTGETIRAKVPVPILDEELTVLVVPATSAEGDLIASRFRSLQRRVLDAELVQAEQFKRVQELTDKPEERAKAIKAARETLDRLRNDHDQLSTERDEVMKEVEKLPEKDRRPGDVKAIDDRLRNLKSGEAELIKHLATLEKIDKEENDPKRKEWLIQVERAKQFVKDGDIGKALEIYNKVPTEFNSSALQRHVEELKKAWEPKSEAHKLARDFVQRTFPNLTTEELPAKMKELKDSLAVFEKADDVFSVSKLIKGLEDHAKRMQKELDQLKQGAVDDEKPIKRINDLAPELGQILRDAQAFLKKKQPAKEGD